MKWTPIVGIVLAVGPLGAQPQISLGKPTAVIDGEFNYITSVSEITGDRVIFTDVQDQKLYLGDLSAQSARVLGRKGRGPNEWFGLSFLRPAGRDTTLMFDVANRRVLVMVGQSITGVIPPDHPTSRALRGPIRGADALGNLMVVRPRSYQPGLNRYSRADSDDVIFVRAKEGTERLIARTAKSPEIVHAKFDANGKLINARSFWPEEDHQPELAVLAQDGWLAIVRFHPFRVDWRSPAGAWTKGKPLDIAPVRVTAAERDAIAARFRADLVELRRMGEQGLPTEVIPKTLPLVEQRSNLRSTLDGHLAVRLSAPITSRQRRWIFINHAGTVTGFLTLSDRQEIVGFGKGVVYIAEADDDDVLSLQRVPYTLPVGRQ